MVSITRMHYKGSRLLLRKLINKAAGLCQPDESSKDIDNPTRPRLRYPAALAPAPVDTTTADSSKPRKMAEEEDFSSLPLTDRWVHKVRVALMWNRLGKSLGSKANPTPSYPLDLESPQGSIRRCSETV
jgi:hypothetical protein